MDPIVRKELNAHGRWVETITSFQDGAQIEVTRNAGGRVSINFSDNHGTLGSNTLNTDTLSPSAFLFEYDVRRHGNEWHDVHTGRLADPRDGVGCYQNGEHYAADHVSRSDVEGASLEEVKKFIENHPDLQAVLERRPDLRNLPLITIGDHGRNVTEILVSPHHPDACQLAKSKGTRQPQ